MVEGISIIVGSRRSKAESPNGCDRFDVGVNIHDIHAHLCARLHARCFAYAMFYKLSQSYSPHCSLGSSGVIFWRSIRLLAVEW